MRSATWRISKPARAQRQAEVLFDAGGTSAGERQGARAECAALKLPDKEPFLVEHLKQEEKMLQHRLDDLRAELPTLEALTASLNDEQNTLLLPGILGSDRKDRGAKWTDIRSAGDLVAEPDGDLPPPPPAD